MHLWDLMGESHPQVRELSHQNINHQMDLQVVV